MPLARLADMKLSLLWFLSLTFLMGCAAPVANTWQDWMQLYLDPNSRLCRWCTDRFRWRSSAG